MSGYYNKIQAINQTALFFFDTKKEPKSSWGIPPKPKNALRLILFKCLVFPF